MMKTMSQINPNEETILPVSGSDTQGVLYQNVTTISVFRGDFPALHPPVKIQAMRSLSIKSNISVNYNNIREIKGYICFEFFFFLLKNFFANEANCFLEAGNKKVYTCISHYFFHRTCLIRGLVKLRKLLFFPFK